MLGKKIQPVVEDPQSLVQVFAEKAKKLLLDDKVVAVLGCYTSASRQSVLPVFEENNGVLLYPTLYEAQECSKNCFYTGAVPNQQLDDFVPWIIKTLGRKNFYLIGANYIYPKETNREVKALLQKHGGHDRRRGIFAARLDRVLDQHQQDRLERLPISSSPTWSATRSSPSTSSSGNSASPPRISRSARRSPPSRKSRRWGRKTRSATTPRSTTSRASTRRRTSHLSSATRPKYGKDAVTNAVMEAAYFQTYFLAQAIEKVKSTDADALIFEGLPGQEFQAPQGKVKIDEKNHHTWLWARIGKANEQGQFDVVWKSEDWIRPAAVGCPTFIRTRPATSPTSGCSSA